MSKDWIIKITVFLAPFFPIALIKDTAGEQGFYVFYAYLAVICLSAFRRISHQFIMSSRTIFWMLIWMLVSFVSVIWGNDSYRWLISVVQLISLGLLVILTFDKKVVVPNIVIFIPIVLYTLCMGVAGVYFPEFLLDMYESTNILGIGMYIDILFLVWALNTIDVKTFRILVVIAILSGLSVIILSETRSVLLGLAVSLLTYCMLKIKSKFMPPLIFYSLFVASILLISYYISTSHTTNFEEIEVGNKQVYTGREEIWPVVLLSISDSPIYGHGSGAEATTNTIANNKLDVHYIGLSAHNHHLQLLYQIGLLGFIPFLLFVKNLFYTLIKVDKSLLGASFLIGILFQQNFEVLLTQNNFILGIPLWVSILANFQQKDS